MRLPGYVQDTLAHAREDRLRAVALVATLLLPWMLIFARAGIEVCGAVIGLCFLWHSYRTRQWQWLEEPFTRLCLVAWGWLALVVTPLALTPATSATDALLWFRLPLLVLALRHFVLRTKAARTVLGMMLLALLMLVMLDTLWQYVADTSLTGHARLASGRLTGPFTGPKVGLFLGYMLLPALALGLAYALTLPRPWMVMAPVAVLAAVGLVVILLSGERAALLSTLLALGVVAGMLGIAEKRLRVPFLLALLALGAGLTAVYFASPWVQLRTAEALDVMGHYWQSDYGQLANAGLHVGREHWLHGVGLHGFRDVCPDLYYKDILFRGMHPHNIFVEWFAEAGLPGLLLVVGIIITLLQQAVQQWRLAKGINRLLPAMALGVCAQHFFPLMGMQSSFTNWSAVLGWYTLAVAFAALPREAVTLTSTLSWTELGWMLRRRGLRYAWVVLRHQFRLKRGYYVKRLPVQFIKHPHHFWYGQPLVAPAVELSPALLNNVLARADEVRRSKFRAFRANLVFESKLPQWFKGVYAGTTDEHFSRVAVNDVAGEDVKTSWDLSRFHWATELAVAAVASSDEARATYLARLNTLTTHWLVENGYQRGVNWACAHEVALRGFQLMMTSMVLVTHLGLRPGYQLLDLMVQSWRRVYATRAYGRVQANHQSVTEHLFLIYAAAFLTRHQVTVASPLEIAALQQDLLPLMETVVLPDGGTAMHSTNDHRALCDVVAFAKLLDDAYGVGMWAQQGLQQKVAGMAKFLAVVIDPASGEAPLLGVNDGSLHAITYAPYAKFEPSLLLLCAAFGLPVTERARRYSDAVWLFGYAPPFMLLPAMRGEQPFDDFGLLIVDRASYRAYVKYPRRRYSPSQADFLHVDLWVGGVNVLTDSGTYSHNPPNRHREDGMSEPAAHNAPLVLEETLWRKISLRHYRDWPDTALRYPGSGEWEFRITNGKRISLSRSVRFEDSTITLRDQVRGAAKWAVVWNGALQEGRETMTATAAEGVTLGFSNVQHLSISDALRADHYLSYAASRRLTVTPAHAEEPIITELVLRHG